MAIPADTIWEVNTTGSDTAAGGGFSTAQKGATGTDMTYPTPTVTTFTSNLSAVGTTTLTCSSALFTNTMLGNVIQISGQGFYCIQGFTSTTVVTVDRALGTFATTSGWVGGALASPGQATAVAVASNYIWIKTGTYTISSTSANVSTGIISISIAVAIQGYGVTRGDDISSPTLQVASSGVTTVTVLSSTSSAGCTRNISIDGQSKTSIAGMDTRNFADLITISNCTNGGFGSGSGGMICRSSATNVTGGSGAFWLGNGGMIFGCEAYANTVPGFYLNAVVFAVSCIARGNTGASSDGFLLQNGRANLLNCVAYGNGRDGVRAFYSGNIFSAASVNTIAEGNAGYGFSSGGGAANARWLEMLNCAGYNNTLGNIDPNLVVLPQKNFVAGSGSFFVNAAAANFALNTTAGAGASCRAAGIPGIFPKGLTTGYPDIGAAQHADPVKLLTVAGMTGGME